MQQALVEEREARRRHCSPATRRAGLDHRKTVRLRDGPGVAGVEQVPVGVREPGDVGLVAGAEAQQAWEAERLASRAAR